MEEADLLTTIKHGQHQAEMYLFQGNITQALCAIQLVLNVAPASAETLKILGNIQQKQGNLIEAKHSYLQAIKLEASFAPAYANLGSIYALENNWQEAIQYYQQAIQLQPDLIGIYRNLAKIWQHLGNDSEFYKCRYYVIMADPNTAYYDYVQLGHKLLKIGEKDKAIDCYERCLTLNPQHYFVLQILGDLSAEAGDLERAIEYYQKSLNVDNNRAVLHFKLGNLYMQKFLWDEALNYFMNCLKLQPDYWEAYPKINHILEKQNKIVPPDKFTLFWMDLQKFLPLPEKWEILSKDCQDINRIDIHQAEMYFDTTPSITTKNNQNKGLFRSNKLFFPETYVCVINHGLAWGDNMHNVIMTSHQQVITDISGGFSELILGRESLPPEYLSGNVAFLGVRWGNNYFHWMFDSIVRIKLLIESGFSINSIDKFIVNHYEDSYRQETLNILGIPLEKVIETKKVQYIQADILIVPSYPHLQGGRMAKWACDYIKSLFLPITTTISNYGERIYISRSQARGRHLINEEEVIEFLNKKGFVNVFLESMSVKEQAICFAGAKVIVAPHGAGLTNLVFCQPETQVIELFSANYHVPVYWQICQTCQLIHYHLVDQNNREESVFPQTGQDLFIKLEDIANILEIAGIN